MRRPGKIYDLGAGRYGLAYNDEQHMEFRSYRKVYLHVFLDPLCTKPETDPATGKKYVTLKNIETIEFIGYSD